MQPAVGHLSARCHWLHIGTCFLLLCAFHAAAWPTVTAAAAAAAQEGAEELLVGAARIRAVYPVALDASGALVTSSFTLCGAVTSSAAPGQSGSAEASGGSNAAAAKRWCAVAAADGKISRKALTVAQSIVWSTMTPPGVYPSFPTDPSLTPADLFYDCAVYRCDMANELPAGVFDSGSSGGASQADSEVLQLRDAFGGLSPATPCCGSTNATFLLLPPVASLQAGQRLIVQTNVLPMIFLRSFSQRLLNEVICGKETSEGAPAGVCRSDGKSDTLVAPSSSCLLRISSPRLASTQSAISGWNGDGGLLFPVAVSLCGTDISDVISTISAKILRRGYTAIVVTREHADSAAFPAELIRSILYWVAKKRGNADERLAPPGSKGSKCEWRYNASAVSFYRTGKYVSCELDSSMVGYLPSLTLTVSPGVVLFSTNATDSEDNSGSSGLGDGTLPCAFTVDLNSFVVAPPDTSGSQHYHLVLHSTGSTTSAMKTDSLVSFREPYIILGAALLTGATLAVSRLASYSASGDDSLETIFTTDAVMRDLPVMFLTALNAPPTAAGTAAPGQAVCVAPPSCKMGFTYYPSLNICVDTNCLGVFAYMFNPHTMQCSLRPVMPTLFAIFAFVMIVGDVVLILTGRWAEKQRRAHMKLVEQVQRSGD